MCFDWIEPCNFHISLLWRHNEHDSVSNHQPRGCLLNRLFRRRSKKTSKLRVTGLCVGNSPGPVNSPHKGPVTRKMFPFDDVIMIEATSVTKLLYWTADEKVMRPSHLYDGNSFTGFRADSRFASSQWETALLCNDVSHWLCASLESALGLQHINIYVGQPMSSWRLSQSMEIWG